MALTAKKVYAILNGKIKKISGDVSQISTPLFYAGTVAAANALPTAPRIGAVYNIKQKSIYGEAGMNVAWNGSKWDSLGPAIDTSLLLTKEEAEQKYLKTIPQASNTTLGGIKAKAKTTESVEVVVDSTTNKAYVPDMSTKIDATLTKTGEAADAKVVGDELTTVKNDLDTLNQGGLVLKDTVIAKNVTDWLNDHPEATTTVVDESITEEKLNPKLKYLKKISAYENIAEMRADNHLKEGNVVITLGYYKNNDYGGAMYHIRKKVVGIDENIGDILLNNGLIAVLMNEGDYKYNVCQLGIVPNTGEDLSPKLQKIFDTRIHNAEFYFPSGTYIFKSPLILKQVTSLVGDMFIESPSDTWDKKGTIFKFEGGSFENKTALDGCSVETSGRNKIKGIRFMSDSFVMTEDRSILLTSPDNVYKKTIRVGDVSCLSLKTGSTVEDCVFYGFSGTVIKLYGAYCLITKSLFKNSNIGFNTYIDNRFVNNRFEMMNTCIVVDGSANLINTIRADSIADIAILFDRKANNTHGNTITDTFIDFCYKSAFLLRGSSNKISTNLGRCCAKHANKRTIDIADNELTEASAICFDGENTFNKGNKIDCVLSKSNMLDSNEVSKSPITYISILKGDFINTNVNISLNESLLVKDLVTMEKQIEVIRCVEKPSYYISATNMRIAINGMNLSSSFYIPQNGNSKIVKNIFFTSYHFCVNNIIKTLTADPSADPSDCNLFQINKNLGKMYMSEYVDGKLKWIEVGQVRII